MPRPGLRVTPTVAAHRTARSRNVPWPPQRPSGARQSPAYGKRLQMSHPLRPCQARQGEDGLPPVADAGNQQGQGLDGGDLASYPWRTLCIARRYPSLAGLCASEHSPNPARWADPTTQHPFSRMDITMAFTAKKTEHTGAKHRRGTYWGPKRDAKLESHRLRRRQGKCLLRHEEQLPAQSKVDKLRTALRASAGGWKALIDAEEIIKKLSTNRLVSTRPVPTWDPADAERPPALRVL